MGDYFVSRSDGKARQHGLHQVRSADLSVSIRSLDAIF
jgi:hypothetical protein